MRYHDGMSVSALTPSPISTRPYLLRALYEWCTDNGYTPYIAAYVDDTVQVPREHVKNNEIVLNISMDATSSLKLGNEFIEFKARFSGTPRQIMVPIDHVIAIYARENGQGMSFPVLQSVAPPPEAVQSASAIAAVAAAPESKIKAVPKRATLKTAAPEAGAADAASVPAPRVVQLVKADASSAGNDDDNTPPPAAPSPAGARPALKRVK
jgi:stringent starvation protein B